MPKGEHLKGRPRNPGSGRKKGTGNKYAAIREQLLDCFEDLDLPGLVKEVREEHPVEALKLLVSLLPKQIEADVNTQLTVDAIMDAMDEADERAGRSQ